MNCRQIITFADGAEDAVARTQMAWELASQQTSVLDAVVPVLMPMPMYGTNLDLMSRGLDELRRRCLIDAQAAAERLKAIAPSAASFRVHTQDFLPGDLRALAAVLGRTGDLVMIGQPDALDHSSIDTDIFIGALLGSGRPCLMLPRWKEPRPWGRRALIAWKGKPETARAVAGALPLLSAAATRVCIVNPGSARDGEDQASLDRVADYLRLHDVDVEAPVVRTSTETAETVIAAEIEAFGADLLVMGAYSRPRMQEIIFGGMTTEMVRGAQIPVLFAH